MSDSKLKCPTKQSKPFSSLAYLAKSTSSTVSDCSKSDNESAKVDDDLKAPPVANGNNVAVAVTNGCHGHKTANINGHLKSSSQFTTDNHNNKNFPTISTTLSTLDELCEEAFRDTDEVDCCSTEHPKSSWELQPNSFVRNLPASLSAAHHTAANGLSEHNGNSNGFPSLSFKYNSMDSWDYTIELECLQGPQGVF